MITLAFNTLTYKSTLVHNNFRNHTYLYMFHSVNDVYYIMHAIKIYLNIIDVEKKNKIKNSNLF